MRKRSKPAGESPKEKRTKKYSTESTLLRRYPAKQHTLTDADTVQQHIAAMNSEIAKKKPREIVVLPLLKQTYSSRRDFVTSPERSSVKEILEIYPGLKLPSAVSY